MSSSLVNLICSIFEEQIERKTLDKRIVRSSFNFLPLSNNTLRRVSWLLNGFLTYNVWKFAKLRWITTRNFSLSERFEYWRIFCLNKTYSIIQFEISVGRFCLKHWGGERLNIFCQSSKKSAWLPDETLKILLKGTRKCQIF